MKKNSKLKMVLLVVSIILISLISYVGVYKTQNGLTKNIMPDYDVGKELGGTRLVTFEVDESTEEIEIAATEEGSDEAKTESVPVNSKEALTYENYEKSKNIMKERADKLGLSDYDLRFDEKTGTIVLEIAEKSEIDEFLGYLVTAGNLQIVDTETNEVLLNRASIVKAETMYSQNQNTGATTVFLNIVFDENGKTKLEEISKTYIATTDEEGKTTKKTISIYLDDSILTTTYFGETISSGELRLAVGSETTDSKLLQNYFIQSEEMAIIVNSGVTPVIYNITSNEYVSPIITTEILNVIILLAVIVVIAMIAYLIIRYNTLGVISAISAIGYIALYLLVVRFTDTVISLESMAAIGIGIVLQFVFVQAVARRIKTEDESAKIIINKELLKNISIQIPLYIMAVVFVFASLETMRNFGIAMFWGLAVALLYNFTFTKAMFIQKESMKK